MSCQLHDPFPSTVIYWSCLHSTKTKYYVNVPQLYMWDLASSRLKSEGDTLLFIQKAVKVRGTQHPCQYFDHHVVSHYTPTATLQLEHTAIPLKASSDLEYGSTDWALVLSQLRSGSRVHIGEILNESITEYSVLLLFYSSLWKLSSNPSKPL